MSIEETYDWAKKVKKEFEEEVEKNPDAAALNTEISKGGDHPVQAISFSITDRPSFRAEVAKVDGDLIFHFFPARNSQHAQQVITVDEATKEEIYGWLFLEPFKEALATSFLEVFRHQDKLFWDYVEELRSWVVRAQGFSENIMAEELADKLFDTLQKRLET